MVNKEVIKIVQNRIVERHQGDKEQLAVIFSNTDRILVEAPAGYGKTNTMVSKIAYMIASKKIPAPKKLLALTFSVNAAYKIKKDVSLQIPALLKDTDLNLNEKLFVTNYHGFCRNVLRKYGTKLHPFLAEIDKLQSFDDSTVKENQEAVKRLTYEDACLLSAYSDSLKSRDEKALKDKHEHYCQIVLKEMLPSKHISYNSIIALTLKLFKDYPNILKFYNQYFNALLVDEYQDTNFLSYWLVSNLITDKTRVILLGDSLQRIYGFIGAVDNLLELSKSEFSLEGIRLAKNYRFANNPQMLQLDSNIRRNAENPAKPVIDRVARINIEVFKTQEEEASAIVQQAAGITATDSNSKVAVLVKQRGANVDMIVRLLEQNNTPYFYGLFTDEDPNYIQFHRKSLFEFIGLLKNDDLLSKKMAKEHLAKIELLLSNEKTALKQSLIELLEVFWKRLFIDYASFSNDEKILLVKDTFEHNGLKQFIEFIEARVIVSTVHGAKGLEWDYVILPDMEQNSFPNWVGNLCKKGGCKYKSNCIIKIEPSNEAGFLEELSVFYVAVTRARKEVFFTASRKDVYNYSKNLSCFLSLPGIISHN